MKKFWAMYFLGVVLFLSVIGLLLWFFFPLFLPKESLVVSPIPNFLTMPKNNQVTTLDIWTPIKNFLQSQVSLSEITAKNALSYDLTTEKVIFSKNPDQKVPLASLTKIVTAIVALEHPKKDDAYLVTSDDLVGEDSMGLASGETLSLQDLLYGLILHSGNDAAETIASNFSGGRSAFIDAMNEKAKSLGLTNTHFTNPTGLQGDGDQYTTAYDLLVLTRYALENFPTFKRVVATFDYTIYASTTHKEYDLENETNLLTSYPGVKGVKTGFTPEAGLCLVTYLEYKDHKIIAILLGSDNRREEMKQILDYTLEKQNVTPPQHDM